MRASCRLDTFIALAENLLIFNAIFGIMSDKCYNQRCTFAGCWATSKNATVESVSENESVSNRTEQNRKKMSHGE